MLKYDPVADLQHFPVAGGMSRFGLNPFGAPLYRVVFAPSRRYLVCGQWPDGSDCAQWCVKHENLGCVWIMEKWLPAVEFAGCSREEWNRSMLTLGPWPERGEYELCHVFDVAVPSDANIQQLITYIEAGRRIPLSQTLEFRRKQSDLEAKSRRESAEALIKNRLPAYGCRPFVGGHVHRGAKTVNTITRTAEELGLPTRSGAYTGKKASRLIAAA